ncbi:MAG: clostripain-related cysteine peptidase [Bacteroidales bacterium]|nr:clostripain-related cysteine peptidase [Bacteroidales bacterium]
MKILQNIPIYRLTVAALALLCLISCDKHSSSISYKDKIYSDRKILILYSAAHNSLSSDNWDNMEDLIRHSDLHTDDPAADAILIYSHSGYSAPNPAKSSYLIYPHLDWSGSLVIDTLATYPSSTISATASTLNMVLTFIRDNFPADEYGLVFSSHGTGYVPAGYYSNSTSYENDYTPAAAKSIGQDYYSSSEIYEINLEQFAEAIPMYLKYIAFDACLMGGIETAYQLRDKTEWLIASQAEILAEGMDYKTMASYLMARPNDDLAGFCENYYNHYNALSGDYQSATMSLVNCSKLEPLAKICSELFPKYREELDALDHNEIQRYYTYSYHWFFDLGDIVEHLGCTEDELAEFNAALDNCVSDKFATEKYLLGLGGSYITHYSGLSMMLPNYAGDYLKNYYKTNLDWNFATSLVE